MSPFCIKWRESGICLLSLNVINRTNIRWGYKYLFIRVRTEKTSNFRTDKQRNKFKSFYYLNKFAKLISISYPYNQIMSVTSSFNSFTDDISKQQNRTTFLSDTMPKIRESNPCRGFDSKNQR